MKTFYTISAVFILTVAGIATYETIANNNLNNCTYIGHSSSGFDAYDCPHGEVYVQRAS